MFTIFKNVIKRGGYNLTALLKQIDTYHIEGKITDDERTELHSLARQEPKAQYNYDIEIEKLWAAMREMRTLIDNLHATTDTDATPDEETPDTETIVVPEFVQPQGAFDAYQVGDTVKYNGSVYQCVLANCVWSPDVLPSAWTLIETETDTETAEEE